MIDGGGFDRAGPSGGGEKQQREAVRTAGNSKPELRLRRCDSVEGGREAGNIAGSGARDLAISRHCAIEAVNQTTPFRIAWLHFASSGHHEQSASAFASDTSDLRSARIDEPYTLSSSE
jgi:hypothetical protein